MWTRFRPVTPKVRIRSFRRDANGIAAGRVLRLCNEKVPSKAVRPQQERILPESRRVHGLMVRSRSCADKQGMKTGRPESALQSATKTGAGKQTIGLNPALVQLLIPLVASRPGERIGLHHIQRATHYSQAVLASLLGASRTHCPSHWVQKSPRIHDLRHTRLFAYIQDGVFAIPSELSGLPLRFSCWNRFVMLPEIWVQSGGDTSSRST